VFHLKTCVLLISCIASNCVIFYYIPDYILRIDFFIHSIAIFNFNKLANTITHMGRKKLQIENVDDERVRRVMFKKRRVGLLKKAMQLSKLTNAMVDLRIYQPDDSSLVEYISSEDNDFASLKSCSENVLEYSKLENKHYRLIINLEQRVNNYRNHNNLMEQF